MFHVSCFIQFQVFIYEIRVVNVTSGKRGCCGGARLAREALVCLSYWQIYYSINSFVSRSSDLEALLRHLLSSYLDIAKRFNRSCHCASTDARPAEIHPN